MWSLTSNQVFCLPLLLLLFFIQKLRGPLKEFNHISPLCLPHFYDFWLQLGEGGKQKNHLLDLAPNLGLQPHAHSTLLLIIYQLWVLRKPSFSHLWALPLPIPLGWHACACPSHDLLLLILQVCSGRWFREPIRLFFSWHIASAPCYFLSHTLFICLKVAV